MPPSVSRLLEFPDGMSPATSGVVVEDVVDLGVVVEEAQRLYAVDTARLAEMSDDDVVWLTRRNSLSDAYLAEIGRR